MRRQRKVLIVEDDWDVRTAATLRLSAAGYETLTADDGMEAVASAVRERPDVIVLDIRMPRMDGLRALARLRELDDTRNTPVVMLSASLRDQQAALDAGASFFVTKPYQGSTLLAAVKSAITGASRKARSN